MEKIRDLEVIEMIQISGGTNIAYEIGYALGRTVKRVFFILTAAKYL
jgi:hypothetical protein